MNRSNDFNALVGKPVAHATASLDELAPSWMDHELAQPIDDDVMADAISWLNEQLEGCNQPVAQCGRRR